MVTSELLEQLQRLSLSDKHQVLKFLEDEIAKANESLANAEPIIEAIFREYPELFRKLAESE